jgi:hypothetical protein
LREAAMEERERLGKKIGLIRVSPKLPFLYRI